MALAVVAIVTDTTAELANRCAAATAGPGALYQFAPPAGPEFHDNHTRVHWRFGFDLTGRLRKASFDIALLCTEEMADAVASGGNPGPSGRTSSTCPTSWPAPVPRVWTTSHHETLRIQRLPPALRAMSGTLASIA